MLVAAGLLGPAATPSLAQGTIMTTVLPQPAGIWSDLNTLLWPIDLNGDGLEDFTFGASPGSASLRTERANQVIVRLSPPPNIGGRVARLDDGYAVGSSLDPQLAWLSSDPVGGYVSPGEWAFASIAIALSSGESSDWPGSPGARGFIGIGFELDDGFHYGYFDVHMVAEGGGVLFVCAPESFIFSSGAADTACFTESETGTLFLRGSRRSCVSPLATAGAVPQLSTAPGPTRRLASSRREGRL